MYSNDVTSKNIYHNSQLYAFNILMLSNVSD